jgi:signal transduction histidine kinase
MAVAAIAVSAIEAATASRSPFEVTTAVLAAQVAAHILVGLSFVASAIVALTRRPTNAVGALLAAIGFVWFLEGLEFSANAVAFTIGYLAAGRFLAPLGHLFLAFPGGSLRSTAERRLVAAVYAWAIIGAIITTIFLDFRTAGCSRCPRNVLMVANRADLRTILDAIESGVSFMLAIAVFVTVARRWRDVTGPSRRVLQPVIWATGPAVAVVGLFGLADVGLIPPTLGSALAPFWAIALAILPVAFLVGLLRTRLDRSMVADLLLELNGPLPHGRLREVLARVLRDPSLEVAFRLPGSDEYIDAGGRIVPLLSPGAMQGRTVTVVESGGEPLAALIHDVALLDNPGLVDAVGSAARLALENERLHVELRAQLEEVRTSRARIVSAADDARRKIERDLHDGAQQRLLSLAITIAAARSKAGSERDSQLDALLREALEETRTAVTELRELARGIHPVILTDAGLGPAFEALGRRAAIPTSIAAVPGERFPAAVEAAAYFFVSEALANAAKHSDATQIVVAAASRDDRLIVEVTDDGVGGADPSGAGLRGLQDRVAALGGTLTVGSTRGNGTRLVTEIPVEVRSDDPGR